MNQECFEVCERLIPPSYIHQAQNARRARENKIRSFLEHRKWPVEGWDEATIELLLHDLSLMDSNNFPGNVGAGERESRIASNMVFKRHYRLGHGIGRSGDIAAIQPKAAGSSLIMKLTNCMALDAIKMAGVQSATSCLVLPVATGMSMVMVMLTLRKQRPNARYVIWPRIDQKSCFKSISTAGFIPVVIENLLEADELRTDVKTVEKTILELGADSILCIATTTSCFAPRVPDRLEEVAKLCKHHCIPHLVNNAYGIQSSKCMHLIQQASLLDEWMRLCKAQTRTLWSLLVVQLCLDLIANLSIVLVKHIPGEASASPSIDLFITLLSLGSQGYQQLLKERKEVYKYLADGLKRIAESHGEKLLDTKHNPISLAISLTSNSSCFEKERSSEMTLLGSMLFTRCVSGARVVSPGTDKEIEDHMFKNWGSHSDAYPCSYLTAAAAIGMTQSDADTFLKRLDKCLDKFTKKPAKDSVKDKDESSDQDSNQEIR